MRLAARVRMLALQEPRDLLGMAQLLGRRCACVCVHVCMCEGRKLAYKMRMCPPVISPWDLIVAIACGRASHVGQLQPVQVTATLCYQNQLD